MARSVPVPIPRQPMTLAEHRQLCYDILRTHLPTRTWRSFWRRRCSCGARWLSGDGSVGCWVVRGAVAELGGLTEFAEPTEPIVVLDPDPTVAIGRAYPGGGYTHGNSGPGFDR